MKPHSQLLHQRRHNLLIECGQVDQILDGIDDANSVVLPVARH